MSHLEMLDLVAPERAVQKIRSVLIANRGEIAIRIARAASELGLRAVAVFSTDDEQSLHVKVADAAIALEGEGPSAYLNIDQIIQAALDAECNAIHPGYGFLSENALFARKCQEAGIIFVGPAPETLELFGDKGKAREFAASLNVPVPQGTNTHTSLEQMRGFMGSLADKADVMIKAVAGGGGRGMRIVQDIQDLDAAYARCQSEALGAFGCADVYIEECITHARHIEVQIVGDGNQVAHIWERDCSLQRRNQKIVEIAPSPWLSEDLRARILHAALVLAEQARFVGLGTFEFLVDGSAEDNAATRFVFIEANPRLQVEHTITEEVTGLDLVKIQLGIANGLTLAQLGCEQETIPVPRGYAIQFRINMETMGMPGVSQTGQTLIAYDAPSGPGVRVDSSCYQGFAPSQRFDSLLAKLIVHSPSPDFQDLLRRAYRALCEFRIDGLPSNLAFLRNLLKYENFGLIPPNTRFVDEHLSALIGSMSDTAHRLRHAQGVGAVAADDAQPNSISTEQDPGSICSPLTGKLIEVLAAEGQRVVKGDAVAVIDAMKMEYLVFAEITGKVRKVYLETGAALSTGDCIMELDELACDEGEQAEVSDDPENYSDAIRPDLIEVRARHAFTLDESRPDAVARRRKTGQRTARENIQDLCDEGSFLEYGALAVAGQRATRSIEELMRISPADGFIYGLASVNRDVVGKENSRCMVASYDYTVFAGTQGLIGHKKHDRMFELALRLKVPLLIFTEGGGGRPADSDNIGGVNLANPTFSHFARLSGKVPLVGIVSGRCFAGNAALLGFCDVTIATDNATIGMGGPAMIEGAGLGVFKPEEVGPAAMHARTGVVDILVADEEAAVAAAKKYLAYFQGPETDWTEPDAARLRNIIPVRRTRAYEVREVINHIADVDSVLELRKDFGRAAVTALIRIEGRAVGLIANNPMHNAGAIGADEADKLARFIQLCDVHGLPIISLCDTPGIMVGPDAEKTALVRHSSRIFVTAANISVPLFTVVLRKAYGLGAMAMGGGSFNIGSVFAIAWPTAEFGSMGIEGQIRLGYKTELEAITDPAERQVRFQELVDGLYERGKSVNVAPFLSIDDVIDPIETRDWIKAGLITAAQSKDTQNSQLRYMDTW